MENIKQLLTVPFSQANYKKFGSEEKSVDIDYSIQ